MLGSGEEWWNRWSGVDRQMVAWFVGHKGAAMFGANKCLSTVCQLSEALQLNIAEMLTASFSVVV